MVITMTVAELDGLQFSAQSLSIAVTPRYLFSVGFLHSPVSTNLQFQLTCALMVIHGIPLALCALLLEVS